jgi:hypothetical protein
VDQSRELSRGHNLGELDLEEMLDRPQVTKRNWLTVAEAVLRCRRIALAYKIPRRRKEGSSIRGGGKKSR